MTGAHECDILTRGTEVKSQIHGLSLARLFKVTVCEKKSTNVVRRRAVFARKIILKLKDFLMEEYSKQLWKTCERKVGSNSF